jgi:hypothetical protein
MANPNKVGLTFGSVLGGWHLVWAILVALNWAQPLYDFILWAHMIHLQITIGPFDLIAAITLIVITSIVGYLFGCIGALVWNRFG